MTKEELINKFKEEFHTEHSPAIDIWKKCI